MGNFGLLKEFLQYVKARKKWWLAPIALILLFLAAFIYYAQATAAAPFIYTMF
jgi:hypothetical protein